ILGARIAIDIDGAIFNRILAIIMIVVVLIMVFNPKIADHTSHERTTGRYLFISLIAFFFIGIYGGFINAGIGFIIMLFLNIFNKINLVRVNAVKVGVVFIYTIAALVTFAFSENVNWFYGLILAVGTSVGAWTASRFSVDKGEGFIKLVMIVMVLLMAIKLWLF
ncbi:MAG: sulfite exporter TauE/SafE family protein, partial [Flavobacteriales bacterium]|nr:sulfite exporter TauE/SafE family protein [Flavobacteriales bacterium]